MYEDLCRYPPRRATLCIRILTKSPKVGAIPRGMYQVHVAQRHISLPPREAGVTQSRCSFLVREILAFRRGFSVRLPPARCLAGRSFVSGAA
jgi:hypothetical protein